MNLLVDFNDSPENKSDTLKSIEENIIWLSVEGKKVIDKTTSIFSDNCFNCLSGENLPGADYWKITLCEGICQSKWLKKSSSTDACDSYDPQFKEL